VNCQLSLQHGQQLEQTRSYRLDLEVHDDCTGATVCQPCRQGDPIHTHLPPAQESVPTQQGGADSSTPGLRLQPPLRGQPSPSTNSKIFPTSQPPTGNLSIMHLGPLSKETCSPGQGLQEHFHKAYGGRGPASFPHQNTPAH
jgi:hypothetical protein